MNSKNKIFTYKMIGEELLDEAGFCLGETSFYYYSGSGMKQIELDDEFEDILYVNETDSVWSPVEHDLIIKKKVFIETPSVLFGVKGVTGDLNKIGIGMHVYSKGSHLQYKRKLASFGRTMKSLELNIEEKFLKNTLRDTVKVDFFFYLESVSETLQYQANKVGMLLSNELLYQLTIIVDGNDSIFPIREVSESGASLWSIERNWADPLEDPFDINHVYLKLNISHPLFALIKEEKNKESKYIMQDIMIQSMTIIINEVIHVDGYSIYDYDLNDSNSILAIVKYWVETFDIDLSSVFSISNSLRETMNKKVAK